MLSRSSAFEVLGIPRNSEKDVGSKVYSLSRKFPTDEFNIKAPVSHVYEQRRGCIHKCNASREMKQAEKKVIVHCVLVYNLITCRCIEARMHSRMQRRYK